ncbi:hypothetical protein GOBAR_AA20390 [Gossypium barbadense]|uniref:Uncharacterized protein n=1 Tax=Gossypium barbadense TaxID=3634 RepID=A0A2P5XA90_GOSBA|nr:hypothetical protein GOBAR_AA20390 [Gossypium barbadense]
MEIKLTERMMKPANYFYHYCRIVLRPSALLEFELEEEVRVTQLSLTSTDSIVLGGAGENSSIVLTAERVPVKAVEDLTLSLCHLLSEVGTLGLRYAEARDKKLADNRDDLDKVRELYKKMREENEIINEQQ